MPAPYSLQETAQASGLSQKYIRRLKESLPSLFEKNTERGANNSILFNEEILEILKETKRMKNKGRTLQQIRDELAEMSKGYKEGLEGGESLEGEEGRKTREKETTDVEKQSLKRENDMLRSQVQFLQGMVNRAEARFDRLLPEPKAEQKKESTKSWVVMWLVEALVVTIVASGFVGAAWFFGRGLFPIG